jgi:hypothetical protein
MNAVSIDLCVYFQLVLKNLFNCFISHTVSEGKLFADLNCLEALGNQLLLGP